MKITLKGFIFKVMFMCSLIYILMRPALTYILGDFFKYIFLISILFASLYGILLIFNRKKTKDYFAVIVSVLLFDLYAVFSAIRADATELLILTLVRYILYSCPIFFFPYVYKRINWENVLKFISLFGIIDTGISVYEYITHTVVFNITGRLQVVQLNGAIRTFGLNGNYFILAEILSLCGLVSLYLFFNSKEKKYFCSFIWITIGVFTTGTRGYYVSYLIGIFVLIMLGQKEKKTKRILKICVLFITVVILTFIIFGTNLNTGLEQIDIVLDRFRTIVDWSNEQANSMRMLAWRNSVKIWKDHLFFGNGACATEFDYSKRLIVTESGFLKRLVELGLVGTVLQYISLFVPMVYGAKKYFTASSKNRGWSLAFAVIACSMAEDMILQMYTGIEFTIVLWFCVAYIYYQPIIKVSENEVKKNGVVKISTSHSS